MHKCILTLLLVQTKGWKLLHQRVGLCLVLKQNTKSFFQSLFYCLVTKPCLTLSCLHGLESTRFLCPWDFPAKKTGVGCHSLLQGNFLTQGFKPDLLYCRQTHTHTHTPQKKLWATREAVVFFTPLLPVYESSHCLRPSYKLHGAEFYCCIGLPDIFFSLEYLIHLHLI